MQISVFGAIDNGSVDASVEQIAQYRDEGFARVWLPQMPYDPDLLTVLAVVLREVDGIEAASGVVPIQVQHPMLLAQRALTLSLISGGRFTLGIGLTHRTVTEGMWGIPYDKPVRRLNQYLDGLLPLLAGQPADAAGEMVTTRGALVIRNAPNPAVYIAALGPPDVAGGRPALGGHDDVDDRAEDTRRSHRPDAPGGGQGSRPARGRGASGRGPSRCRDR